MIHAATEKQSFNRNATTTNDNQVFKLLLLCWGLQIYKKIRNFAPQQVDRWIEEQLFKKKEPDWTDKLGLEWIHNFEAKNNLPGNEKLMFLEILKKR